MIIPLPPWYLNSHSQYKIFHIWKQKNKCRIHSTSKIRRESVFACPSNSYFSHMLKQEVVCDWQYGVLFMNQSKPPSPHPLPPPPTVTAYLNQAIIMKPIA